MSKNEISQVCIRFQVDKETIATRELSVMHLETNLSCWPSGKLFVELGKKIILHGRQRNWEDDCEWEERRDNRNLTGDL